ncbi:hypothetical protein CLAIMM_14679, partial [Cladophialophora immunda]
RTCTLSLYTVIPLSSIDDISYLIWRLPRRQTVLYFPCTGSSVYGLCMCIPTVLAIAASQRRLLHGFSVLLGLQLESHGILCRPMDPFDAQSIPVSHIQCAIFHKHLLFQNALSYCPMEIYFGDDGKASLPQLLF